MNNSTFESTREAFAKWDAQDKVLWTDRNDPGEVSGSAVALDGQGMREFHEMAAANDWMGMIEVLAKRSNFWLAMLACKRVEDRWV